MIKISIKELNGKSYIRLRRKIDGVWRESKKRVDLTKKQTNSIVSRLQTLCSTIDADLNSGEPHTALIKSQITALNSPFDDLLDGVGLLDGFSKTDYNLENFLISLINIDNERVNRGEIVQSTVNKRQWSVNYFLDFCHAQKIFDIRNVTLADVLNYRDQRLRRVAASSVQGEIKWLRGYFKQAVMRRVIEVNPFVGCTVEAPRKPQQDRRRVVDTEVLSRIENWLHDNQPDYYIYWSVVRWTGCRKNEALLLEWSHIDFESSTMIMPAPKTARKGIPERKLPIFPELKPILEFAFAKQDKPNNGFVVRNILNLKDTDRSKVNWSNKNAGPHMERLIIKAGESPWPKLFQNLRVTRENELLRDDEYRRDAIHAFIGHTSETFDANYKHLSDDDFIPRSQRSKADSPQISPQNDRNLNPIDRFLSRDKKKTSESASSSDDPEVDYVGEAPPAGDELVELLRYLREFRNNTAHSSAHR